MTRALSTAIAGMRSEWAGNTRLRLGALAIGAILAFYAFLLMGDWRASLAAEYAARTEHLYKMRSLAGQSEWLARAGTSAEVRAALEAEIPEASTTGLAQANLQGWFREITNALGSEMRVQALEPTQVAGRPGVWRVPVTVSGALEPQRFVELLRRIESRTPLTVIEQAMVRNRSNQTFSLTVVAYFRIPEDADAAG